MVRRPGPSTPGERGEGGPVRLEIALWFFSVYHPGPVPELLGYSGRAGGGGREAGGEDFLARAKGNLWMVGTPTIILIQVIFTVALWHIRALRMPEDRYAEHSRLRCGQCNGFS